MKTIPISSRWFAAGLLAVVTALPGCRASAEPDPRCRVETSGRHSVKITRTVNGSKLWRAFLEEVQPSRAVAKPLVEFKLSWDHKTKKGYGGDYDPGTLLVDFKVTNLRKGGVLFDKDASVELKSFLIGAFDKNATREELQEIAFKATEDKVYPYLERWVDLAAIRAMAREGSDGKAFVPMLEKMLEDKWISGDIRNETEQALAKIGA